MIYSLNSQRAPWQLISESWELFIKIVSLEISLKKYQGARYYNL